MVEREGDSDSDVGYIQDVFVRGSREILLDPEKLEKSHPTLYTKIRGLQDSGKEVWGQFNAHKGAVLTVIGAGAAAAGVIGIGYLLFKRENKEQKNT
jgi:hypothetical protein